MRQSIAGLAGTPVLVAASASGAQELDQGIAKFENADFAGALSDLIPFAEQGGSTAQTHVAVICANGEGVVRANVAAATWMRLATEQEHAQAQFNLAQMYERGRRGTAQDPDEATKWYERAARLGYASALFRLGTMHEQGVGVARDLNQAVNFYRMAAEQDQAAATIRFKAPGRVTGRRTSSPTGW